MAHDNMGNDDNITEKTFEKVDKEKVYEYLTQNSPNKEFDQMFEKAAKAWGQPVEEAKKNTLSLLKRQLKK